MLFRKTTTMKETTMSDNIRIAKPSNDEIPREMLDHGHPGFGDDALQFACRHVHRPAGLGHRHADDAVDVENQLHKAFADMRVNRVNERREFFFATPAQVREVLTAHVGNILEFTEEPEATQYLQSRKYWPAGAEGAMTWPS
jgi:hypothetical protein